MKNKLLIVLLLILALTGCKEKEMEDRDFVMVLGVEKNEDCSLYADIAELKGGDNLEISNKLIKAEGNTINSAINKINKETSGELFLGHIQSILVNGDNCKSEVQSLVKNNYEIGRDIPVVKCSNIDYLINNEDSEILLQDYITKYFENNKHQKINIESYLNEDNKKIDLPEITVNENSYAIK